MKRSLVDGAAAALVALLFGCGGSGGNAALSKSFNYGAAQAPTTQEQSAASSADNSVHTTASFSTAPDANGGVAIALFADALATAAMGSSGGGGTHATGQEISHALRSAEMSTCATVTGNTVTYKNCSQTESGFTITLNGSISATAGTVSWNLSGSFSGSSQNVSLSVSIHHSGAFTVTSSKLTGDALSELGGNVSGQGQSISFGLHTAAIVDLTYQSSPSSCITGGSIEVKRVWTVKPSGATGPQYADAGVKLTWTGCKAVQVARSQ